MKREATATKEGEVLITGPITPDASFVRDVLDEDAVSAKDIREALDKMKGDLIVRINSPGGHVSEAAEIFSRLQESQFERIEDHHYRRRNGC